MLMKVTYKLLFCWWNRSACKGSGCFVVELWLVMTFRSWIFCPQLVLMEWLMGDSLYTLTGMYWWN